MSRYLWRTAAGVLVSAWTALAAEAPWQAFYPNGLEMTILRDSGRPMAAVMALVGAGVRSETFGTSGATHFLEHLLFNGTESLDQEQLYEEIDLLGGYCNAATREECTLYFLLVPPENVARAVWLLDQMLYHSVLPAAKVEKERGVILSEIRQEHSSDGMKAAQALRLLLYRGTPYALPIIGTETGIASLPRDSLMSYYRALYVPNNTKLVLMGNLSVPDAVAAVETTFARESPAIVPPVDTAPPAALQGRTLLTMPVERPRVYVVAETPAADLQSHAAMEVLEEVLRLRASGRRPRAPDVEWEVVGISGRLIVSAIADEQSETEQTLSEVRTLIRNMKASLPSREEVAAAKARLRAEEFFLQEKLHFFLIARPNELWRWGPRHALDRVRRIDAVTWEDVRSLASEICTSEALGEVVITPLALPPPPSRKETVDTTVAGMPTRMRTEEDAPLFGLHVLFRDRSLWEPVGRAGMVEMLHRLVAAGPDTADLAVRWASLGAQVTFCDNPYFSHDDLYVSPRYSYIRLELPQESWQEGVELLGQCLRAPRITQGSLAKATEDIAAARAYQARDARYAARRRFLEALLGDHPAGRPALGSEHDLRAVTVGEMADFHRSYMARDNAVVTVVSGEAPDEVSTALARLLPEGASEKSRDWPPLPETVRSVTICDTLGSGRAYVVWGYVVGPVPPEQQAALRLAVASLSTALVQQVREERGLAYGVGASLAWLGDEAWLQAEVSTRPEVADDVVAVVQATVEEHRVRQFSDRAVRREAEKRRGRSLLRSLSRVGEAYYMGMDLLEGRHPLHGEALVGPEEMADAAKRFLRTTPSVTVIVR